MKSPILMAYEMLCHKCFEDYIKICQAHPPPDPDDAIAAFSRSLPQVPPTDGPAVIRDNTINNGDEEEQHKPAAEEEDEQEEDAPADEQEPLPPWHYSISWKEMYTSELHQMDAKAWLNVEANMSDYADAYPSILIAALQGHPNIPNGSEYYKLLYYFNIFF
jgi:hypothetical protein